MSAKRLLTNLLTDIYPAIAIVAPRVKGYLNISAVSANVLVSRRLECRVYPSSGPGNPLVMASVR